MDINIELASKQTLKFTVISMRNKIQELENTLAIKQASIDAFEEEKSSYEECVSKLNAEKINLTQEIEIRDQRIQLLEEHIAGLKQALFGTKSEKRKPSGHDSDCSTPLLDLAGVPQIPCTPTEQTTEPEQKTIHSYKRRKPSRRKESSSPVINKELVATVEHSCEDATENGCLSDHTCICGSNMIKKGEKVITKLVYKPGTFEQHQYHVPIYECPNCSGEGDKSQTVLPDAIKNDILPEAMASNNTLSFIITNKYAYGLPLYRQNDMFVDLGIDLNRSTECRWIIDASEICAPLVDEILLQIQGGETINMDETTLQVLMEDGRANTQKSYLWHMAGGKDGPCRYFFYNPSRSGQVASKLIGPFQGFLQTDGYAVYNAIGNREGIIHVGCLDHIRRKFVAVNTVSKDSLTYSIADMFICDIRKIYKIESELRSLNLPDEEFLQQRATLVKPILATLVSNTEKYMKTTYPGSSLGRALTYAHGQWGIFGNYLLHPDLGPSNQLAENGIRPFVIGRKNYLFAGHPNGARALDRFLSLIETAKVNNVRPIDYLNHVFSHIRSTPEDKMADLLPWNCDL